MAVTFLIVLLVFLLHDLYISLALMRGAAWWAHVLLWLPAIVALCVLLSARHGLSAPKTQLFTELVLCVTLPQIVLTVFSLLGKLIDIACPQACSIGNGIGIAAGAVIALLALYGLFFGWKTLTVRKVDLSFANLPEAFDGYKIVQLSDLHVGTYGDKTAFVEKVVRRANEENADLIAFTGDLINTSPTEIAPFEQVLSQLKAKDGVMSVLGNHDYCIYAMSRQQPLSLRKAVEPVIEAERRMGWDLLLNEHRIIHRDNDSIALVGVENTGKPPFPEIGDLKGALAGIPDDTFTILLSHDPSHWRMEVVPQTSIPLTLSGHTHAMQFKVGRWSPSKWLYPEWSGLYEEGPQRLFVSEGIGGTIPFRLGTKPEIVVVTLRRKKSHPHI